MVMLEWLSGLILVIGFIGLGKIMIFYVCFNYFNMG